MRPDTVALIAAGAALLVVLLPGPWRLTRNVITIVHEAGHALTALLAGRRLRGIRLHSDTSGLTLSRGRPYGAGMVCTALAGYPAPSLLGLLYAGLLATGHPSAPLVLSTVLLAGVLVMVRNAYGVVSVLLTGAVLIGVSWLAPAEVQDAFAQVITWFLLFGGIRPVGELQRIRRRGRAYDSDADQLGRLTGTPGFLWVGSFGLIGLGALVLAGGWLLA
ncbi:MAG TPA: M50 family metallopeptidase [Actinophytocola sp.]|uniref:M50 family metallopeptidase n=1 Tax=Actinophytocola sp. TaxID=1872138 RepID=UPI002DC05106|nr:M50 family metallopeptidase [Actinophytocola sp.]HEU5469454.1 M50 family metallopeptidase [Actinophytocola sp.]